MCVFTSHCLYIVCMFTSYNLYRVCVCVQLTLFISLFTSHTVYMCSILTVLYHMCVHFPLLISCVCSIPTFYILSVFTSHCFRCMCSLPTIYIVCVFTFDCLPVVYIHLPLFTSCLSLVRVNRLKQSENNTMSLSKQENSATCMYTRAGRATLRTIKQTHKNRQQTTRPAWDKQDRGYDIY